MARSKEVLVEEVKAEFYRQFVAILDSLSPYRDDVELYNTEVLDSLSNLSKRLDRAHALAAKRKTYTDTLPTATVEQIAAALDDLATVPAEPDPTNPPVEPEPPSA
jgi:prephenate dehydrogenase